jgi:hypothetical protein
LVKVAKNARVDIYAVVDGGKISIIKDYASREAAMDAAEKQIRISRVLDIKPVIDL